MTKKDEKPPVLLIDDEDDPGASSVKPGILYSSMTELRGFKLGPSGTSLGLGRPGSSVEDSDSESSPPVKTDPAEFARLQNMLARVADASVPRARDAEGDDVESPRIPVSTEVRRLLDEERASTPELPDTSDEPPPAADAPTEGAALERTDFDPRRALTVPGGRPFPPEKHDAREHGQREEPRDDGVAFETSPRVRRTKNAFVLAALVAAAVAVAVALLISGARSSSSAGPSISSGALLTSPAPLALTDAPRPAPSPQPLPSALSPQQPPPRPLPSALPATTPSPRPVATPTAATAASPTTATKPASPSPTPAVPPATTRPREDIPRNF